MADLLPFYLLTELQAAQFRDATRARQNRLEPVLIRGGGHKGKYALPTRVASDPAHADLAAAFAVMVPVALNVTECFPPVPDED
jgi:hypothetical protein